MSEFFHKHPITAELVEQSIVLEADHFPVEEAQDCPTCAEGFEVGQQAVEVYAPSFYDAGRHRAVWYIHLRCYQGEEFPT